MNTLDLSPEAQKFIEGILNIATGFLGNADLDEELQNIINLIHEAKEGVPNLEAITDIMLPLELCSLGEKTLKPEEIVDHLTNGRSDTLLKKASCIIMFNKLSQHWITLAKAGLQPVTHDSTL